MAKIKIITLRMGEPPCVEEMENTLDAMQEIVGGLITCLHLVPGVDLWANDEGFYACEPNRQVTTDYGYSQPIFGNMFIAANDGMGETVGLTDAQVVEWLPKVKEWGIMQSSVVCDAESAAHALGISLDESN